MGASTGQVRRPASYRDLSSPAPPGATRPDTPPRKSMSDVQILLCVGSWYLEDICWSVECLTSQYLFSSQLDWDWIIIWYAVLHPPKWLGKVKDWCRCCLLPLPPPWPWSRWRWQGFKIQLCSFVSFDISFPMVPNSISIPYTSGVFAAELNNAEKEYEENTI